MPKITDIRPVLLSAPYANNENLEVRINLKSGFKTCGLVEITLEDGTTGLGEAYLAVFAPHVFEAMVKLAGPYLLGKEILDINARYNDLCALTGYWSLQGAARHVVGACEIAMVDAKAKFLGVPAYTILGGKSVESLRLYGSGGDSATPQGMEAEFEQLQSMDIDLFKIRAQNWEVSKTVWTLERAASLGIAIGVDMCQNLANPAQTASDVVRFLEEVYGRTKQRIVFLEEALGPMDVDGYALLRSRVNTKICGGEIMTTAAEMCRCVERNLYDFVQPDATVIGGIGQVLEVFAACRQHGSQAVVHCWGGAVCMMANYHAAFAGGGQLAEWPLPEFAVRQTMMTEPLAIAGGNLIAPATPGLGVKLTPEIEAQYPFREEALYTCLQDLSELPPDRVWEAGARQ